jgi:hypothetical protein
VKAGQLCRRSSWMRLMALCMHWLAAPRRLCACEVPLVRLLLNGCMLGLLCPIVSSSAAVSCRPLSLSVLPSAQQRNRDRLSCLLCAGSLFDVLFAWSFMRQLV